MKFFFTAIAAGTLLLQVSCNRSPDSTVVNDVQLEELSKSEAFSGESGYGFIQDSSMTPRGSSQQVPPVIKQKYQAPAAWNKKVIKNGLLNLEVENYNAFSRK